MWRLDVFEGSEYKRQRIRVTLLEDEEGKNEKEEEVETETYIWIAGEDALDEGEWDLNVFVREKMGMWVDGSKEYEGE